MTAPEAEGERVVTGRLVAETVTPTDAATILLVRDGDAGLEVFLLERHLRSDFAGGAFVFPGGKLDPDDGHLDPSRWSGIDPAAMRASVGAADTATALGLHVAAVRETFEEAGVLLARRGDRPVTAEDLASAPFRVARAAMNVRGEHWDWRPWLAAHDLVLDLAAIALWSWWVTPEGVHRRFDARFFIALVPPGQEAALAHDEIETTSSRWMTPQAALEAARDGEVTIIYPTRQNLAVLAGFATAEEAWAAGAAGATDRRRLVPVIVRDAEGKGVRHPDGGPVEHF